MVLAFFNHAHTESTNVVEYIYLLPSVCWMLNNSEQPLQAVLKSHILHDLSQLKKKKIKKQNSKLYMAQLNTFLKRMNLGASPLQQPNPAVMEITCLPDWPCSVALGIVKIALNPRGLKWLVYSGAWSYTNTRQVLFPADFHWRGLGHWMIPNLCFCHHDSVPGCFQGSILGKMSFPGCIHCKTEDQLFPALLQLWFRGHRFICSKENRSQHMQWCSELSCVCPATTVFTLIPTEECVWTGEVDHKSPFHSFALAKVPFRIIISHFANFAFTVPSARVYLRSATPKGEEPFPFSLEATAGLDQFLQAFSQEVTQLAGSNTRSSTWKAQEAVSTSALQKSGAPLICSSQLHVPPASHDSMSRVKREGREGRHSLGIPGSQAEKNNSTF